MVAVRMTPPKPGASVARSSAGMALGTAVSRATGFARTVLIATALGSALFADAYTVANTLPNILFILLIGGALNAVFVPQLARAMAHDTDGGTAFTDRLLTVTLVGLLAVTGAAWVGAPAIVDLYADFSGAQRDLTITFARYCLPQIFFYGAFTMLGQILNARGSFAPMAWAPVVNNLVVVATFGLYLGIAGTANRAEELSASSTRLLGLGTTAGIAIQAAALIPFLYSAGFRWRPRFDWRGAGLNKLARLAGWMVAVVVVTQLGYLVVTRLATQASVAAERTGIAFGVGYSAYSNAHLLWLLPHSIVAVSLLTAVLPRMSRAASIGSIDAVRDDLARAMRATAVLTVPAALFFLVLGPQVATSIFLHGQMTVNDTYAIGYMLSAFGLGLIPFSAQYLMLRTFYALDDAKTPFVLTSCITGVHIALSLACYVVLPPRWAVTGIAASYALAYLAGYWMTRRALRARLGFTRGEVVAAPLPVLVSAIIGAILAASVAEATAATLGDGLGASMFAVTGGFGAFAGGYSLVLWRLRPGYLTAALRLQDARSVSTGPLASDAGLGR